MPTEIVDSAMEVEAVVAEYDDDDDDDDDQEDDDAAVMEVEGTVDEEEDDDDDDDDDDQSVAVEDNDEEENDDEEEEVLASAVVVDADVDFDEDDSDEEDSAVVEANVEEVPIKVTAASTASEKSTSPSSNTSKSKTSGGSAPVKTHFSTPRNGSPKSAAIDSLQDVYRSVPPPKLAAARDARGLLQETVPTLPVSIAETQVRSFGHLCIQSVPSMTPKRVSLYEEADAVPSRFSTTSALYPAGFSCDRYEFSPVHGRILKLRCSILSGISVKEGQKRGGFAVQTDLPDGPIFRIMWGRGVDEDAADELVDYPFDPFTHSRPLFMTGSTETDSTLKETMKSKRAFILPAVGMRVKVRYDKDRFFVGSIASTGEPQVVMNGKKKRTRVEVTIQYDDGVVEELTYPDPDLSLLMPGMFRWLVGHKYHCKAHTHSLLIRCRE
jgi:hypothetical protein